MIKRKTIFPLFLFLYLLTSLKCNEGISKTCHRYTKSAYNRQHLPSFRAIRIGMSVVVLVLEQKQVSVIFIPQHSSQRLFSCLAYFIYIYFLLFLWSFVC